MTSAMGSRRFSRVVRGTIKKAKNHHLVIFGMLEIQLEMSFWASMAQMRCQKMRFQFLAGQVRWH